MMLSLAIVATLSLSANAFTTCRHSSIHQSTRLHVRNTVASPESSVSGPRNVEAEVMALRASEIKSILTSLKANTKGLYDKEELAKVLIQLENESLTQSNDQITSLPMFDQSHGDTPIKYVGIDIEINRKKVRFMIDTGATINLIKKQVITQLGLNSETEEIRTVGLGGGGTVAGSKTKIKDIYVGNRKIDIDAAILDNEQALPDFTSGLLGLNFLTALGEVVEFDFIGKTFKFGPREKMLSPMQKRKFYEIPTRRITSGLIAADVRVNGGSTPYTAMIDMGNVHTIANSLAVKAISNVPLSSLPVSPFMCQGIDGTPVSMRAFVINEIRVGEEFVTHGPLSLYAADIPGMFQIGLGNSPSFILGMDVIRKNRLIIDMEMNRIYLLK